MKNKSKDKSRERANVCLEKIKCMDTQHGKYSDNADLRILRY